MRRTPTGKRIELTARDIEIFRLLERHRYLRSTFIHAFVGGASETRFKERLGDLYHEGGYLDRPKQQWEFAKARYAPVVYEITTKARHALDQCEDFGTQSNFLPEGSMSRQSGQFAHTLMICEILASIELATREYPALRFIPWPEILAKAPDSTRRAATPLRIPLGSGHVGYVVPDAIFGLEYAEGSRKAYRFFVLEADRATMPVRRSRAGQSCYADKLLAYRRLVAGEVHKTHLGVPNLLVLTVTNSERHEENLRSVLREVSGKNTQFLFKALGEITSPMPTILSAPWERVGCPPLTIASP